MFEHKAEDAANKCSSTCIIVDLPHQENLRPTWLHLHKLSCEPDSDVQVYCLCRQAGTLARNITLRHAVIQIKNLYIFLTANNKPSVTLGCFISAFSRKLKTGHSSWVMWLKWMPDFAEGICKSVAQHCFRPSDFEVLPTSLQKEPCSRHHLHLDSAFFSLILSVILCVFLQQDKPHF